MYRDHTYICSELVFKSRIGGSRIANIFDAMQSVDVIKYTDEEYEKHLNDDPVCIQSWAFSLFCLLFIIHNQQEELGSFCTDFILINLCTDLDQISDQTILLISFAFILVVFLMIMVFSLYVMVHVVAELSELCILIRTLAKSKLLESYWAQF